MIVVYTIFILYSFTGEQLWPAEALAHRQFVSILHIYIVVIIVIYIIFIYVVNRTSLFI